MSAARRPSAGFARHFSVNRLTTPGRAWSDASTQVADQGCRTEEIRTMATTTLTMAGHLAHAGAARPVADLAAQFVALETGYGTHQVSTWTKGALAMPTASQAFGGRKNRPTRPLSEHSP